MPLKISPAIYWSWGLCHILFYFFFFTLIYRHASRIVAKYSIRNSETMTYVLKCQDLALRECQLILHAASLLLLHFGSIGFCLFCAKFNNNTHHFMWHLFFIFNRQLSMKKIKISFSVLFNLPPKLTLKNSFLKNTFAVNCIHKEAFDWTSCRLLYSIRDEMLYEYNLDENPDKLRVCIKCKVLLLCYNDYWQYKRCHAHGQFDSLIENNPL